MEWVPKLNLAGQTFGRLTVISESPKVKRRIAWLCQCSCGNTIISTTHDLRNGDTRSCGCLKHDIRSGQTHGDCKSAEYRAWMAMKDRCSNPNHVSNKPYHDRGIAVCEKWIHSYENFLEDMGRKPNPKMTLDRIDNDGNYNPDNCRWATIKQQNNNSRHCRIIEYKGERRSMSQWADLYNITSSLLRGRIDKGGWDIEKALLTPVKITNKNRIKSWKKSKKVSITGSEAA